MSFNQTQTILLVLAAMVITWLGFSIQLRYVGTPAPTVQDVTEIPAGSVTAPNPIDFPTFLVMGTVKEVKSGLLKVEVTGFSDPGVTEIREVSVSPSTQFTLMTILKSPQAPSPASADEAAAAPPQSSPISQKDIKVGDTVSVSSGKLDVKRVMRFTAVSVIKIQEE